MQTGKVHSTHYEGDPGGRGLSKPLKIDASEIKSMQSIPLTVTSYGQSPDRGPLVFDSYVIERSANNVWYTPIKDYNVNGRFSAQIDDVFGHEGWKAAGTDIKPINYNVMPDHPNMGFIEGPQLRQFYPNRQDTPTDTYVGHEILNAVGINQVGNYVSKRANHYADMMQMLSDPKLRLEIEEWVDFLAAKGIDAKSTHRPGITALGVQDAGFVAAYYPDRGFFVRNNEFVEMVKQWGGAYGLEGKEAVEAQKRAVYFHEIAHVLGVEGDQHSEAYQGALQKEFYSKMASSHKGEKLENVYRVLAEIAGDYEKMFSSNQSYKSLKSRPNKEEGILEKIEQAYEKEGKALGLHGKELHEYVESRSNYTFRAFNKNYRGISKVQKKDKSSDTESLESIVNEGNSKSKARSSGKYVSKSRKYKSSKTEKAERHSRESAKENYESREVESREEVSDSKSEKSENSEQSNNPKAEIKSESKSE